MGSRGQVYLDQSVNTKRGAGAIQLVTAQTSSVSTCCNVAQILETAGDGGILRRLWRLDEMEVSVKRLDEEAQTRTSRGCFEPEGPAMTKGVVCEPCALDLLATGCCGWLTFSAEVWTMPKATGITNICMGCDVIVNFYQTGQGDA
jgi:hypothetical protein